MEEKKKKKNFLVIIFTLFFIVYFAFYLSQATGYYELKRHNKMVITTDQMKRFEKDVSEGKDISIDDYITNDEVDYTNAVSRLGYNTSEAIEFIMIKGIKYTFGFIGKLFSE